MTRYQAVRNMVWVSAAVMMTIGCNPAAMSYFLFKGDGKAPADNPLKPAEGRKDVVVAILMNAPNVPVEFAGVDRDLCRQLGNMLTEESREKKPQIRCLDLARVEKFKSTTPGWKSLSPSEIGKALGADYVIDGTITGLSLYQPGNGRYIYQGTGHVSAIVYDSATGKEFCKYYVNPVMEAKPSDSVPVQQYKEQLVQRIAAELSWKHVPHVTDRRVAPVQ